MEGQKPKRPRSTDKGTSVSRRERIKSFSYDAFGDVIADKDDDHISVMQKEAVSKDPELRLDCIECVKDWLDEVWGPVGCVFNIWEYDILEKLANQDSFCVIMNFQPWMVSEEKGVFDSAFNQLEWLAQNTQSKGSFSFPHEEGLHVYARWDDYGNQALMHEKFLIAQKWDEERGHNGVEALYGSFNMPQSGSKKNLESILHFKKNSEDIICDLGLNFELILQSKYAFHWRDLRKIVIPENAKKYGS